MAQELEIKLSVARTDLDKALEWLLRQSQAHKGTSRNLVNHYYDTPEAELNRQKIALRMRQVGDQYIQTLKTQGEFVDGAHRRQEWEWPLIGSELNIGLVADTPVGQGVNLAALRPVFETNFERRIVMLDDEVAVIEVALDSGQIIADGQQRPLDEVEFELKEGDPSTLLSWASALAEQVPVFLNLISKAEQGYYLAGLHTPVTKTTGEPGGSDDSVNRFLHALSVSWLTGEAFDVDHVPLDDIERLAHQRGAGRQFQSVRDALTAGERVEQLARQPDLGQLQLAIARSSVVDGTVQE